MTLFDENMAVGKSKYLVTLYLHEFKQPSDRVISGGPQILNWLSLTDEEINWKLHVE